MIHSIIVFKQESGLPIYTHHFGDLAVDDSLTSGVIHAITSLLREMELGQLRSFITHEKKVLIVPIEFIYIAIVVDLEDTDGEWISKSVEIGEIIEKEFGEIIRSQQAFDLSAFDEYNKKIVEKLLYTGDQNRFILKEIEEQLFQNTSILGAFVLKSSRLVYKLIKSDYEDFELKVFIESPFPIKIVKTLFPTVLQSFNLLKLGKMEYSKLETINMNIFLIHLTPSLQVSIFSDNDYELHFDEITPILEKLKKLK